MSAAPRRSSRVQLVLLAVVIVWTSRRQRRAAVELHGASCAARARVAAASVGSSASSVPRSPSLVGAPLVALDRPLVPTSAAAWSMSAWTQARAPPRYDPGAGLGVDPLASIGTSLRFAVVAALIATVDRLPRRHGDQRVAPRSASCSTPA